MDMGGCEHAAHTQCCAHPCAWGTHEQTLSSPSLLSPSVPRHQGEELAGGSMEVKRLREVCLSWYSEQSIYMVTATDLQLSTSWLAESINRCTQRVSLEGCSCKDHRSAAGWSTATCHRVCVVHRAVLPS